MFLTKPIWHEGLRERQSRRGENHRNHTTRVDLQRHVRRLPAHHATSNYPLGVLHRNAALTALDQYDEGDHCDHQRDR